MSCAVYSINNNGRFNLSLLVMSCLDFFHHTFQICCPVNFVFDAKNHCLTHNLHIIDPCKLFNVLKLIPYVPGLIMTYLQKIFSCLIRIIEPAGQLFY